MPMRQFVAKLSCGALVIAGSLATVGLPCFGSRISRGTELPVADTKADDRNAANSVTPPVPIDTPDPEYTREARKAKIEGAVQLFIIVDEKGKARDIKVSGSLRPDLDQKAIEAVRNWRFKPATKSGHPIAVHMNVEITFKLHRTSTLT